MGIGKERIGHKLNTFKLCAPNGCYTDVFAIYTSVIGGEIKGFMKTHPEYINNPQLLTGSLLKRICNHLASKDVSLRIKKAFEEEKRILEKHSGKIVISYYFIIYFMIFGILSFLAGYWYG